MEESENVSVDAAAPLPFPNKIDASNLTHLGLKEKNLNKWATERIKELLVSVGSVELSGSAKAEIEQVTRCSGDAILDTVRNKKRVGYTYELTLRGNGILEEKRKRFIDVPEFSFGELDDLELQVKLNEDKDVVEKDKKLICQDMKSFVQPVRKKLLQFEEELKCLKG